MCQQSNLGRDCARFDVVTKHIIRIDHAEVVSDDLVQVFTLPRRWRHRGLRDLVGLHIAIASNQGTGFLGFGRRNAKRQKYEFNAFDAKKHGR